MKSMKIKENITFYFIIVIGLSTVLGMNSYLSKNNNVPSATTDKTISQTALSDTSSTDTVPTTVDTTPITTPTTTTVDPVPVTTTPATTTPAVTAAPVTTTPTTTTTAPVTTTTTPAVTTPTITTPVYESRLDITLKTALPNNGKYIVTFEKTKGEAPIYLKYTVEGVTPKDTFWTAVSDGTKEIGDSSENGRPNNTVYQGGVSINSYKNMPTSLTCYVFIKSAIDGKTYYQTSPYTVTIINAP